MTDDLIPMGRIRVYEVHDDTTGATWTEADAETYAIPGVEEPEFPFGEFQDGKQWIEPGYGQLSARRSLRER